LINISHENGEGFKKNIFKALYWFRKGAEKEHSSSLYKLGVYEKNIKKSEILFLKSAKKGNIDSIRHLGYLYNSGINVKKDTNKAIYWYNQTSCLSGENIKKIIPQYIIFP
jgi:TPR repeat protein